MQATSKPTTHNPPSALHTPATAVLPPTGWWLLMLVGGGLVGGLLGWAMLADSAHERGLRLAVAMFVLPLAGLLLWLDEVNRVGARAWLDGDTLYLCGGLWPQRMEVTPADVRTIYRKSYLELLRNRRVPGLLAIPALLLLLGFVALYLYDLLQGTVDPLIALTNYAFFVGLGLLLLLLALRAAVALYGWRWHRSHLLIQLRGWPALAHQVRLDCAAAPEIAAALGYATAGEGLLARVKGKVDSENEAVEVKQPAPANLPAAPRRRLAVGLLLPALIAVVAAVLIGGRGVVPAVLDYRYQPMGEAFMYSKARGNAVSLQAAVCEVVGSFNQPQPECDYYQFYPEGGEPYTLASHYPSWPGVLYTRVDVGTSASFAYISHNIDERAALQAAEQRGGLTYRQRLFAAGVREGRIVAVAQLEDDGLRWTVTYQPEAGAASRAARNNLLTAGDVRGFSVTVAAGR